jgi:hypothetical protein
MKYLRFSVCRLQGRAIAQAVSRWLPTAAARVRARVWSSGICGGQSGAGAGFLRAHRFPLPIFIPPNSPLSQSPGAGTIDHSVADVQSGPSMGSTPPPRCELKEIMLFTTSLLSNIALLWKMLQRQQSEGGDIRWQSISFWIWGDNYALTPRNR